MRNYYELLDIPVDSTPETVKRAYRKKAKQLHPDVNPEAGDRVGPMQGLIRAYETLMDPDRREDYDRRMMVLRPEFRFNYRDFLRSRPEDNEFQSKLVFFDMLHRREDDAIALYDELTGRDGFNLSEHMDREDFMDCGFLLAEEYEHRGRFLSSYSLLMEVIRAEIEKPYFKHFFLEVTDFLRSLVCFRMQTSLPLDKIVRCLDEVLTLPLPPRELAFFLKKASETYAEMGDAVTATRYLDEGVRLDGKLAGTKKLRERLAELQAV